MESLCCGGDEPPGSSKPQNLIAMDLETCMNLLPEEETDGLSVLWEKDKDLVVLAEDQRISLLTVDIILTTVSVIGNIAAIIAVFRRQRRMLYKCCLLSLSLSDILLGLCYSVTYIPKFTQRFSNAWAMGREMCSLVPLIMAMCLLTNSMTLTLIALDRYQAVKSGTKNRWDPGVWICVAYMLGIWALAAGIATPMFSAYDYKGPMTLIAVTCEIMSEELYFCVVPDKVFKSHYFTIVFSLIFLPLFGTFVGFYAVVAKYIWNQRIPVNKRFNVPNVPTSSSTKDDLKSGTYKKANAKTTPRYVLRSNNTSNLGSRSTLITDSGSATPLNRRKENESETSNSTNVPTVRTVHTKRKVRTFKVILVLILTCFIGRMPSWTFNVAQSNPNVRFADMKWWLLQFWFSLLSHFSTALNPFLYGFLNETLDFSQVFTGWFRKVFGDSCVSSKDTGKNANLQREWQEIKEESRQVNQPASIVPRGPYLHNNDNRVGTVAIAIEVNHI